MSVVDLLFKGDAVSSGVAVLLLAMSVGSWVVILWKWRRLFVSARMCGAAWRRLRRTFRAAAAGMRRTWWST